MPLKISGLSKTYPNGVQALKNISLTIGNNMFGLLGPNGAGKSTLMRTIATLQDPDSGTIYARRPQRPHAERTPCARSSATCRRSSACIRRCPPSTCSTHLAVMKGITNAGERKEMVDALLQQTNLWDVRKKALSTYSGGMKQRFGIAQALLAQSQAHHRRRAHRRPRPGRAQSLPQSALSRSGATSP